MKHHVIPARCTLYLVPPARQLLHPATMAPGQLRALLAAGQLGIQGGAGPVDSVERAILDHAFGKATWTPPASYWLGASTTTPTDAAGNFTEPVGNNYDRVEMVAGDWDVAAGTAPASIANANTISMPAATGAWGTLTHMGLFAASSGGTHLWFGELSTAAPIVAGYTLRFEAGDIVAQLGDPTDSY